MDRGDSVHLKSSTQTRDVGFAGTRTSKARRHRRRRPGWGRGFYGWVASLHRIASGEKGYERLGTGVDLTPERIEMVVLLISAGDQCRHARGNTSRLG